MRLRTSQTHHGKTVSTSRASRAGTWQRALAGLSIAGIATLAGCVATPVQPRFVGEVVMTAPPVPQAEVIGVAPAPGYIWIGGFWNWVGGRHVWVQGHWSAPRPGFYWEPRLGAHGHRVARA